MLLELRLWNGNKILFPLAETVFEETEDGKVLARFKELKYLLNETINEVRHKVELVQKKKNLYTTQHRF